MKKQRILLFFLVILFSFLETSCITPQPHHVENICSIFQQYPSWYWMAKKTEQRWYVPVSVQMAIIYQESRFKADAKPPREHIFWVIPWSRKSSSIGYTQALEETWQRYERSTGKDGSREHFGTASDFIGWYAHTANQKLGVKLNDSFHLYLAYHEGIGGYREKTYIDKPWLVKVARKVQYRADIYHKQLILNW